MIDGIQGGPFDVILADPPWHFNQRFGPGTRFGVGAGGHYPTMSDDEICALPIGSVAAPRATLFLWTTWTHLAVAMRAIAAWGFEYLTVGFVWVKTNPNGDIRHGVGYYTKSNTEPCLLARRGRAMKPAVDDVSSVVVSPLREHSRKPEAVRTRIQRMYPTARKVELFCRESADGWATFGNEVDAVGFARQRKLFSQEGAQ
jgi:N6-adenosine-specific RNA methylase IME4